MTLAEWAALDEEVEGELVDGVLEQEEMPSFLHEIVVAWLIRTLGAWAGRRRAVVAADYAQAGVRYCWMVDPQLRSLEIFELGRDGRYAVALTASDGRVRAPRCPGLVVDLDALWKGIDDAERAQGRRRSRRRG